MMVRCSRPSGRMRSGHIGGRGFALAILMNERTIELVIFDCDGVLVDSETISVNVLVEQLTAVGIDVGVSYVQRHFVGRSFPCVASDICTRFGVELPPEFEDRYRQNVLAAFEDGLCTTEGVEDILANLAVSACVATSSSPKRVERSLALVGLDRRFGRNVFTASEVENGKPAPDLFLHAAESMGVAPQNCLVVEDSLSGLRAALAADMVVWRFVGGSHLASADRAVPRDLSWIQVFNEWSAFFEMAPELKRRADRT